MLFWQGSTDLNKALQETVLTLKPQEPIQKVLVAAAIAKQLALQLDKKTVEHFSLIVKNNGSLQGTLTGLDDS